MNVFRSMLAAAVLASCFQAAAQEGDKLGMMRDHRLGLSLIHTSIDFKGDSDFTAISQVGTFKGTGLDLSYEFRRRDTVNFMVELQAMLGKFEINSHKRDAANADFFIGLGYNIGINSAYSVTPYLGAGANALGIDLQSNDTFQMIGNVDSATLTTQHFTLGVKNEYDITSNFKVGLNAGFNFFHDFEIEGKFNNGTKDKYSFDIKSKPQIFVGIPVSYSLNNLVAFQAGIEYTKRQLKSDNKYIDAGINADLWKTKVGIVLSF